MSKMSRATLAEKIRDIDFAMLSTLATGGTIAARPMSNNRDVEYDGDSFFFAFDHAHAVQEIERNPNIGLTFCGAKSVLGKPGIFIAIEATAQIIREKAAFKQHWNSDIEAWAKDGVDTAGLVLIKAHAKRMHYWDGHEEGEIEI